MRIAAISDLHIGPDARTDAFRHDEAVFLSWLDALEDSHDTIVLLGDIFQTDHGLWPGLAQQRRQLDRTRARMSRFAERIAVPPYVLIHGNHDEITTELGALEQVMFGEADFRVLFLHGHQHDPMLVRAKPLSNAATWFSGRVRAAGLTAVAEQLEEQDVQVKARRFNVPDGPYARGARARLAESGARVLVMGHTHVPLRQELPEGLLLNTGTCSRGRRMGVSVDTATGETRHIGDGI